MSLGIKNVKEVEHALQQFYHLRPASYRIEEVGEADIEDYARFISRYMPSGVLLDFGSGSWRLPSTLRRFGFKVTAIDMFSNTDLVTFRSKVPKGVILDTYDGHTLPYPDNTFDAVSSRNVFEHIVHVRDALEELHRVLKPGGLFILWTPNWSGPHVGVRAVINLLSGKGRYWHIKTVKEVGIWLILSARGYLSVFAHKTPKFILIKPLMDKGQIHFEQGDDDAVHLCHPLSFKKWFRMRGYVMIKFNRWEGNSTLTKIYNGLFPSLALSNRMVWRKPQ